MKPSLQFRLSQHLTLTPQLQQSIRLLQLSTVELNQEIERILMENPALEREEHEDAPVKGSASTDTPVAAPTESAPASEVADWPSEVAANWRGPEGDDEESDRTHATPDTPTLRDHLRAQLSVTNLGARDRAFVEILIDALDDDGYLTQPLAEIAALLPAEAAADIEELQIALAHLQHFEPAGVGARSPSECLSLQIKAQADCAGRALALDIVQKHLELLAARDYTRLKSATGADDDSLRAAQRLIQALNPRPGAAFAKVEARYVIPDVIVKKVRNVWKASLNPGAASRRDSGSPSRRCALS